MDQPHWVAGLPFSTGTGFAGRLSKIGGDLVLTDDAAVFKPLGGLGADQSIRFADIEEVVAYADKPPRLRITPRNGEPLVLMVGANRRMSMRSTDTAARDEAVAAIRARAGRG